MTLIDGLRQPWILLVILAFFLSLAMSDSEGDVLKIPISFRKLGSISQSLTFAHMKMEVDLETLYEHQSKLRMVADQTIMGLGARLKQDGMDIMPFLQALGQSMEQSDRMIDAVKTVFTPEDLRMLDPALFDYVSKEGLPSKETRSDTPREKRQLGVAILGVGTLLNLGLSLYNTYEIGMLKGEVTHLRDGMKAVIHVVKEEAHALSVLNQTIMAVNESMYKMAAAVEKTRLRGEFVTAFVLLNNKLGVANSETIAYCQGLLSLLQGRFSPLLIDKHKILFSFKEFREAIKSKGYHLLHDFSSSMFKEEISYSVNHRKLTILIHIPVVRADGIPVYEFLPLPVMIPGKDAENDPLMFVESRKGNNLLAWDPKLKQGTELSSEYLMGCKTTNVAQGVVYICNDYLPILSTNPQKECLGLLFHGKFTQDQLMKTCKVVFSSQTSYAQQIDINKFLVYSKTPTKLTIFCPTSKPMDLGMNFLEIRGSTIVNIPKGCQGEMDDLVLFTKGAEITLEEDNLLSFDRNISIDPSFFPVHRLVDLYHSLKDIRLPERVDVSALDEWVREDTWRNSAWSMGTIAMSVIGITLGCILLYLGYYWLKGFCETRKDRRLHQAHQHEEDRREDIAMVNRG